MACGCKKKWANSSKRNRAITLRTVSFGAKDSYGAPARTYVDSTIWVQVKPLRGVEQFADQQIREIVDVRFVADYLDVKSLLSSSNRTECKVLFNSVEYNITNMIDIDDAHRDVEIYAKRGIEG